jgi:hypothetical protein
MHMRSVERSRDGSTLDFQNLGDRFVAHIRVVSQKDDQALALRQFGDRRPELRPLFSISLGGTSWLDVPVRNVRTGSETVKADVRKGAPEPGLERSLAPQLRSVRQRARERFLDSVVS